MRVPFADNTYGPVAIRARGVAPQTAARPASSFPASAPAPLQIIGSSASLPWRGFLVEKHLCAPGVRSAATTDKHVISLLRGLPARVEYRDASGGLRPVLQRPGSISVIPAGAVTEVRMCTAAELIHCALDADFINGIIAEMEHPPAPPVFRASLRHQSIQYILGLLMQEIETEAGSGRLYVESLAHALATRYLLLDETSGTRLECHTSALPPRLLNRVRERIKASLHADVSLQALADESGYSRAHFLRMFRAATGVTPHQYVLEVRLHQAKETLRQERASLIDVAASCGFSSQSHMTTVFRKHLGVTPGEFRRNR